MKWLIQGWTLPSPIVYPSRHPEGDKVVKKARRDETTPGLARPDDRVYVIL